MVGWPRANLLEQQTLFKEKQGVGYKERGRKKRDQNMRSYALMSISQITTMLM